MGSSSTNIQRLFSTILVIFISFTSSSSAFNVTSLLGPLPQFSTFSNYLTQVGLVQMISDLKNVTILAVPNSKMASISGKSRDEIKRIMSMHVIPEYYDLDNLKMKTLPHGTASLRTVYVLTTGLAKGKQGLLLVTQRERSNSHLFFTFSSASAVPPNLRPNNVNLVQSVVVPSHNISVFHVSDLISSPTPPPPPPLVATELAGSRISISSKVLMKLDQEAADSDELSIFPKTSMDFVLVPPPAKAPAKSAAAASPMKSSTKAPSPSSNSKFGDQKGKSPSSAAPSLGTAPPPAPAIKKPDVPASAPKKPVVPSNPPTEPKAKASGPPTSESSPPPSGSTSTPPPSGTTSAPPPSGTTSAPPPSGTTSTPPPAGTTSAPPPSSTTSAPPPTESPAEIVTPPPPSVEAPAKSSPPTPAAEAPTVASPSGDATPSVEAPKGGATLMTVNKLGVMVTTVMALWALAA